GQPSQFALDSGKDVSPNAGRLLVRTCRHGGNGGDQHRQNTKSSCSHGSLSLAAPMIGQRLLDYRDSLAGKRNALVTTKPNDEAQRRRPRAEPSGEEEPSSRPPSAAATGSARGLSGRPVAPAAQPRPHARRDLAARP